MTHCHLHRGDGRNVHGEASPSAAQGPGLQPREINSEAWRGGIIKIGQEICCSRRSAVLPKSWCSGLSVLCAPNTRQSIAYCRTSWWISTRGRPVTITDSYGTWVPSWL